METKRLLTEGTDMSLTKIKGFFAVLFNLTFKSFFIAFEMQLLSMEWVF